MHPDELNRILGMGPVAGPHTSLAVPFCVEEMTLSTRRCGFFFWLAHWFCVWPGAKPLTVWQYCCWTWWQRPHWEQAQVFNISASWVLSLVKEQKKVGQLYLQMSLQYKNESCKLRPRTVVVTMSNNHALEDCLLVLDSGELVKLRS